MFETTGTAFSGLALVRRPCVVCLGSRYLTEAERCPDCLDGTLLVPADEAEEA